MRAAAFTTAALTVAAAAAGRAGPGAMCGNYTLSPSSTAAASVLVIGDSISMAVPYTPGGYGVPLQRILAGHNIAVNHAGGWYIGGQCSNTPKGLSCTQDSGYGYLNFTGTYDVITVNYGLHDLVNCTDSSECSEHVDVGTYAANVVTLLQRWQPRAKHLMWVTTTPVPNVTTSLGRTYALAVEYNAAAAAAIKAAFGASVTTTDLWTAVIGQCGVGYTSCPLQLPANVHFEPKGQEFLGATMASAVLRLLGLKE